MQFLESSVIGLRSARHVLTSPIHAARITLYPMVHIGEAAFYRQVHAEAAAHDVALLEGVRSPVARHLTRSYRWTNTAALGLVLQPAPSFGPGDCRAVHADLSAAEFDALWRDIPAPLRFAVLAASSGIGIARRITATRDSLARGLCRTDLSSRDDIHARTGWSAAFVTLLLTARDARLCARLDALLADPSGPARIAVIYGAAHMPAVTRHLSERAGFAPIQSDWLTVIGT